MNRARRLRSHVARYSAGKRELLEEPPHPDRISRNVRIELAIGALQPCIGDNGGSPMAWTGDINHVQGIFFDDTVEMGINEVEPRSRPPMPEQAGLDVLERKRSSEQRVIKKINLAYGEIIRCPPITLNPVQLVTGKRQLVFSQRFGVLQFGVLHLLSSESLLSIVPIRATASRAKSSASSTGITQTSISALAVLIHEGPVELLF